MAKAFIYTVNSSTQEVQADGIISPGSVIRRFGCNLNLSGNGIETRGDGYYDLTASVVLAPAEAGEITVTLYQDGVKIPGAIATATVAEAEDVVTLNIPTAIRLTCCGDSASAITCGLSAAASVTNYSFKGKKL